MILFKSACKNIRHNFFVHVVIVLQMIATIVITMIMVSSILIRYQYYTPFKEFFQSKGFYSKYSIGRRPISLFYGINGQDLYGWQ